MIMKKSAIYLTLSILISSCSHSIVRTGYQVTKSDYKHCEIAIKRNLSITDSMQKVGEIKLGESGFSVNCSEADAIQILKNEGCALNADVINITEEKRGDVWSSCYRCRAEFYKLANPAIHIQSDDNFKNANVLKRASYDKHRNIGMAIGAVVAGFIAGFLLF